MSPASPDPGVAVRTLPLSGIEDVSEGTYWLSFDAPAETACDPGHFFMLSPVHGDGSTFLGRPFSIGDVRDGRWRFLVRALGRGTTRFRSLTPGAPFRLVGPLGRPFEPSDQRVHRIVAGGIGLAPFFLLARRLQETRPDSTVELHYGERTASYHVELDDASSGLFDTVTRYTDDGTLGRAGTVVEGACREEGRDVAWYACGPHLMLKALARRLEERGVRGAQFSLEERMACGFGVCQACVVPNRSGPRYRLLCVDGPVVDPAAVAW